MRHMLLILAITAGLAAPLAAQDDPEAVRPGMTDADVRQRWGEPAAVRRNGEWTFLYYRNGMERSVGWMDVVFLQSGQVVDAIVRGAGRTYLGQSSSPPGRQPEATRPDGAADTNPQGAVTGVRMNP